MCGVSLKDTSVPFYNLKKNYNKMLWLNKRGIGSQRNKHWPSYHRPYLSPLNCLFLPRRFLSLSARILSFYYCWWHVLIFIISLYYRVIKLVEPVHYYQYLTWHISLSPYHSIGISALDRRGQSQANKQLRLI